MSRPPERLWQLLPAVHRQRDAAHGEPLRTLLAVVDEQFAAVQSDIETLYEDWFIETCAEWVVPYHGALLGARPIRSVESARVSARAYVANTLAYRRRKGTAAVLEQLARDVTGWPVRAVEFFTRLLTTQAMNHVRLQPPATPSLRLADVADLTEGPFDAFAHTAEVRRIGSGRGRYNIPNVGIYLWRLQAYALGQGRLGDEAADFVTARRRNDGGHDWFAFHPLGIDTPLFFAPASESTLVALAEEHEVPAPLRRGALQAELPEPRPGTLPRFMSERTPALRVLVQLDATSAPVEVPRDHLFVCSIPDDVQSQSPPPIAAAIDPARGRLALPAALNPHRVLVACAHGFSGDLGGGPYDRTDSLERAHELAGAPGFLQPAVWQVGVSHLHGGGAGSQLVPSLLEAVTRWNALPAGSLGVIVVMDSLTEDTRTSPPAPIEVLVPAGSRLLITAGRWPLEELPGGPPPVLGRRAGRVEAAGVRPHLLGDLVVRGTAPAGSPDPGACFVDGFLLEGQLRVATGHLGLLQVAHCTLAAGHGGIVVDAGNPRLRVALVRTICGGIRIDAPIDGLSATDCIVDGDEGAVSPAHALDAASSLVDLSRCTVLGETRALVLQASECLFTGIVQAARRQVGCVRFCYLPPGSEVARRYRCQPDLAVAARLEQARAAADVQQLPPAQEQSLRAEVEARVRPLFGSQRLPDPRYCQLDRRCPDELRTGGEGGGELGAFAFLQQPQREANLRAVLADYLRFGLEAGVFFVT